MRLTSRWFAPAATLLVAAPAVAQNVPTRTLSKPDVEHPEPFTQIAGVRELRDGSVIVVDPRDKIVQAVDLKTGAATRIGREGSGPGEYAIPMGLFALPGDSTAVMDILNRRMLVITPDAKPGGFIDLNQPNSGRQGAGGPIISAPTNITAVDSRGRLYLRGNPFRVVNGTPQAADSVTIERWDRGTGHRDTVAYLPMPKGSAQVSSSGRGNVMVRVGGGSGPYAASDQMAVAPDGRVAIIYADPFRVDFVGPTGQRTRGQPIRYDRVKLSEGHKEQWREQQRNTMGIMMRNDNGRVSATTTAGNRNVQEPAEWPEYLPPFVGNVAQFSPDGLLWLRRTTVADAPPTYDLIDGSGRVVERVLLPKRSRVVGFGNGVVYVARNDEDDLQYLQRYAFKPAGRM